MPASGTAGNSDAFWLLAQRKGVTASKHLHLCIYRAFCMPAACLLPPSHSSRCNQPLETPCLCLSACLGTAHLSPVPRTTLFAGIYSSSHPTPASATTCPPFAPSPSPPPALPSPPSGPTLSGSFLPITLPSPCVQTHWGWGHTCDISLQHSTHLSSTANAVTPWVGMGRDGDTVPWRRRRGLLYLVLLSPDDLRRCFYLAHVLMERVPGFFIHDF